MAGKSSDKRDLSILEKAITFYALPRACARPDEKTMVLELVDKSVEDPDDRTPVFAKMKVTVYLKDHLIYLMLDGRLMLYMKGNGTFEEMEFKSDTGFTFGRHRYTPSQENSQAQCVPGTSLRTFYLTRSKQRVVAKVTQDASHGQSRMILLDNSLGTRKRALLVCQFLMNCILDPIYSPLALIHEPPTPQEFNFLEKLDYTSFEFGLLGAGKGYYKFPEQYYALYQSIEYGAQPLFLFKLENYELDIIEVENMQQVLEVDVIRSFERVATVRTTANESKVGYIYQKGWYGENYTYIATIKRSRDNLTDLAVIFNDSAPQSYFMSPSDKHIAATLTKIEGRPNFMTVKSFVYLEPKRVALLLASLMQAGHMMSLVYEFPKMDFPNTLRALAYARCFFKENPHEY